MFDFKEAVLEKIVVHKVGNKIQDEDIVISEGQLSVDDEVKELLMTYFLSNFKQPEFYQFTHSSDVNLNELYTFSGYMFDPDKNFYDQSVFIAKHLYEISDHPNIKGGELYITYIKDCIVDDELVDAIGIFKSESKETYLKVYQNDREFTVDQDSGVNIKKLDKGCLIFNTEKDFGYKIAIIDKTNKDEAKYWKESFLNVEPKSDDFYQTNRYMDLCKTFVKEVFNKENEVEKIDQIELLNRSVEFFKKEEDFQEESFKESVIENPEVIDAFDEFKEKYQAENCVDLSSSFSISENAVKKQQKSFKSILKLDKNFHIYIHGRRDLIEKGYDDDKGMSYYKVFYEKEA